MGYLGDWKLWSYKDRALLRLGAVATRRTRKKKPEIGRYKSGNNIEISCGVLADVWGEFSPSSSII